MADHPTGLGDIVSKDKIKLPLWMWVVGGAAALGIGVFVYRARKAQTAAASAPPAATPAPAGPTYQDPTTILPIFQGSTATQTGTQPWYPPGVTTGFWYTTPKAMYPPEVAQQAYNDYGFNGGPDFVTLAVQTLHLELANPTVALTALGQYPAGSKLFVPGYRAGDAPGSATPPSSTPNAGWDGTYTSAAPAYTSPPGQQNTGR